MIHLDPPPNITPQDTRELAALKDYLLRQVNYLNIVLNSLNTDNFDEKTLALLQQKEE